MYFKNFYFIYQSQTKFREKKNKKSDHLDFKTLLVKNCIFACLLVNGY